MNIKKVHNTERIVNAKALVTLLKGEFILKYPKSIAKLWGTGQLDITAQPLPKPAPGLSTSLNLSRSAMTKLDLNPSVLSILCGTLLGDGSLKFQKGYANARFQYRHSTRQTDWFMWKTLGPLQEFMGREGIQFQSPDGYQRKTEPIAGECLGKLRVSSLALPKLTLLQPIIGKKNEIVIQRHWLNHMNAYFLMTLWLDDGSLVGRRQGLICLFSTPVKELHVLANYIKTVWQIDCKVDIIASKNNMPQLTINDEENLYKLMVIIAPLIPVKSMLYKVCFYPTDTVLLQRWTAEIKTLVRKEWHEEIDKQYFYYSVCLQDSKFVPHEEV